MSVPGEYSLAVPAHMVKNTCGLSIDIGGSTAKFLYRSRDNSKEAEINTDGESGHLQLVSFPKSRLSEALAHIKQHAQITRNGINDRPEIFATGFGCVELGKTISEALNIRLKSITEFECLVKAFTHLASELPRKELLEPHDEAEAKREEDRIRRALAVYAQFLEPIKQDLDLASNDPPQQPTPIDDRMQTVEPLDKSKNIYPCLLACLGSGTVYLRIAEDGSFKILDMSQRGGTTFHGVGALLTGVTDFDELLELASRGNERNVSLYSDDLSPKDSAASGDDETIYSKSNDLKEPQLIYSFGKATQTKRENFNPEDLAISWLNTFVRDTSQTLMLFCQLNGIKRLFIYGGFCSSDLVRRFITKELNKRTLLLDLYNPQKDGRIKFDFLKPELHLGTIGAMIVQLETSTQEKSKANV